MPPGFASMVNPHGGPDNRATHALETLLARETDEAIRRNALAALRKVRAAG